MSFTALSSDPVLEYAYRRSVMRVLLWFTAIFGVCFAVLNWFNGNHGIMVAEVVMAAFALSLLRVVQRTARLGRWILLYLLPFFSVMMYSLSTALAAPSVFAWVLLIPILSHLLLGRYLGGAIALFYMAIAGAIFFWKFGFDPGYGNARSAANVTLASVCIFGFSHVYEISRERAEQRLRQLALTDPLTGLANRARLVEVFDSERARSRRYGSPLTLLMLDIDHFKAVNDRFGHEAGDAALCRVAAHLVERLRANDLACRLGGEEFCVLLAVTDIDNARVIAETLRTRVEAVPCGSKTQPIAITVSIGMSELGRDGDALDSLLAAADRRLYEAKMGGRNRVVG